jgi:hypothetical protein
MVQVFKFERRLLLMEVDLYQECTRFQYQDLEAKNEKDEEGRENELSIYTTHLVEVRCMWYTRDTHTH